MNNLIFSIPGDGSDGTILWRFVLFQGQGWDSKTLVLFVEGPCQDHPVASQDDGSNLHLAILQANLVDLLLSFAVII